METQFKIKNEELALFVGKNADYYIPQFAKFRDDGRRIIEANFSACLVSIFWLAYRRMWILIPVLAIVGIAIESSICLLDYSIAQLGIGPLPYPVRFLGRYLVLILFGTYANYLYYWWVVCKIRKIKSTVDSPAHQAILIREHGGTTILGTAVWVALVVLSLVAWGQQL